MNRERRRFLKAVLAASTVGLAGCAGYTIEQQPKDTDGDGVVDSQDYAPRDPDVQEKSDVECSDTDPPAQQTPTPGEMARFSFERAQPGESTPPSPWRMRGTAGESEITDQHATHGSRSFHMASYRSDLNPTEALLDVDITRVDTVLVDAYVDAKNANYGDVKVYLDDADGARIATFDNIDNAEDKQYRDASMDVSQFDGTDAILLYVRGDGNDVFWDNVRLLDADGEILPRSAVLP